MDKEVTGHCCDSCAYDAGLKIKKPTDSGNSSRLCKKCGHYNIGSEVVFEVGDWLVLRPLRYI